MALVGQPDAEKTLSVRQEGANCAGSCQGGRDSPESPSRQADRLLNPSVDFKKKFTGP